MQHRADVIIVLEFYWMSADIISFRRSYLGNVTAVVFAVNGFVRNIAAFRPVAVFSLGGATAR